MASDNKNIVETAAALSGAQITEMQHRMRLSDAQFLEALGSDVSETKLRKLRRWKSGDEQPTGPFLVSLRLTFALDRALALVDTGEWDRAHAILRNALPEFMQ